jgi:hypothetical protein
MRESTLAAFLSGAADAIALRGDVADVLGTDTLQAGEDMVCDLSIDARVRLDHLVRLCDACLAGDLRPEHLQAVAFFLIGSDHFVWETDEAEGAVVAEVLFDWSAPGINYPLTSDVLIRYRAGLREGRYPFGDRASDR